MERFIKTVKQFPILWNTEAKEYRDLHKKDFIWKRIVQEINNPDIPDIKTAKNEWKKIRDSHRESLKRMKASTSGQDTSLTNNWKYGGLLEFLLPYIKSRKRASNSLDDKIPNISTESQSNIILVDTRHDRNTQNVQSHSDDSNLASEQSKPMRKKKKKIADGSLQDLLKKVDSEFMRICDQGDKRRAMEAEEATKTRHPLNLFFDSMCESTKKLPDSIQRDVKKKIFSVVCEAEETYESFHSMQQYQYPYSSSAQSTPLNQEDTFDNL